MDYPTSNSGARFTWYCLAGEGGSIHTSLLGPRSQKNMRWKCKNGNNIWTMMARTKAEPESFTVKSRNSQYTSKGVLRINTT